MSSRRSGCCRGIDCDWKGYIFSHDLTSSHRRVSSWKWEQERLRYIIYMPFDKTWLCQEVRSDAIDHANILHPFKCLKDDLVHQILGLFLCKFDDQRLSWCKPLLNLPHLAPHSLAHPVEFYCISRCSMMFAVRHRGRKRSSQARNFRFVE